MASMWNSMRQNGLSVLRTASKVQVAARPAQLTRLMTAQTHAKPTSDSVVPPTPTPTTPHSESAKAAETSEATAAAVESAPEAFNANVISKDPLVSQLVNTLMRDGKKARAQRVILDSMKHLQKKTDSTNPYSILTEAIESASPLLKLTSTKKGSKVAHVPTPLRERQRHRRAIVWIIDAAAKRGEKTFEEKFAAEIYDVSQGVSAVLQKKLQLHKQALANRANAQVAYN